MAGIKYSDEGFDAEAFVAPRTASDLASMIESGGASADSHDEYRRVGWRATRRRNPRPDRWLLLRDCPEILFDPEYQRQGSVVS